MTQRCGVCGCTNLYGCDEGCSWVADDLCSACAMSLLWFAGSGEDEPSLALTRRTTHDLVLGRLAERGFRAIGPVEWSTYDPTYAREALEKAELIDDPEAPGLLAWLTANRGTVLMIARVDYDPRPVSAPARAQA